MTLPTVVTPDQLGTAQPAGALERWLNENRAGVFDRLADTPGLLFRGFGVGDPEAFDRCVRALGAPRATFTATRPGPASETASTPRRSIRRSFR